MTSTSDTVFVWSWSAGATEPVLCGGLRRPPRSEALSFAYADAYLANPDAVSLSPDLPLERRWFTPADDLALPGALRDAAPDWWGRQVVLERLTGRHGPDADVDALDEATYLLQSGSDRFGSTDFQNSPVAYQPRRESASLGELLTADHHEFDPIEGKEPIRFNWIR